MPIMFLIVGVTYYDILSQSYSLSWLYYNYFNEERE
jgi:hypothetical protein